jgi:hypothetical protein
MAMIHISRSGQTLGIYDEARVRQGLTTGEFIGTDLGWTEGMPAWRPLSEIDTFGAPPPSVAPPPVSTTVEATPQPAPVIAPAPALFTETTGLPWENRRQLGFVNALVATIGMVITRPAEAFTVMKREGSLGDALLYTIILGVLGMVASFGFSVVLPGIGVGAGTFGDVLGLGASTAFLLFAPVAMVLGVFIAGGITHLGLMLLGGANRSFETTIRVFCYAGGSANIFLLVPVCGGLVTTVVALVLDCIGLARAHETDTWRPVAAVLLPVVLCCGGFTLVAILAGFAGSLQ